MTSQWWLLAAAHRTAQPSVASRAAAGVTPSAVTARDAAVTAGFASARAVTRGVSRPAVVRAVRASPKMPTQRSAIA